MEWVMSSGDSGEWWELPENGAALACAYDTPPCGAWWHIGAEGQMRLEESIDDAKDAA